MVEALSVYQRLLAGLIPNTPTLHSIACHAETVGIEVWTAQFLAPIFEQRLVEGETRFVPPLHFFHSFAKFHSLHVSQTGLSQRSIGTMRQRG